MSNDIIMRGHRFIIPKSLQTYYVEQLHKGHQGIKAVKHVYWNEMYEHLDIAVKKCTLCNALKPHQQKEKMQIHGVPKLPWTHVSSDIF